jgi:hypothetical protein
MYLVKHRFRKKVVESEKIIGDYGIFLMRLAGMPSAGLHRLDKPLVY